VSSPAEKHLILVRPGQTRLGLEGRLEGHDDGSLTEKGERQVCDLRRFVARWSLQTMACSDLERSVATARLLREGHPSQPAIQVIPELRDLDYGRWQGLSTEEIRERYPREWRNWLYNPFEFAPPKGETLSDLAGRLTGVIDAVKESTEPAILLVVDEVPIQLALCMLLGIEQRTYWRFLIDPASATVVRLFHGEPTVALLNFRPSLC